MITMTDIEKSENDDVPKAVLNIYLKIISKYANTTFYNLQTTV